MTMTQAPLADTAAPVPTPSPEIGTESVSLRELSQLAEVDGDALIDLIDYGVVKPDLSNAGADAFPIRYVAVLKQAEKLRGDLALDSHAFALAVMLCDRIVRLETELALTKKSRRCLPQRAGSESAALPS